MPNLTFTNPEVAQVAGVDPWQRQQQFSEALDVNEMAQAAATYRQAAVEASSTGQLAQKADEVSAGAGTLDAGSIIDPNGRIQHTALGMQDNGKGMAQTGDILVRSMNWAIEEEEKVRNLISGPGGLDEAVVRHNQNAVAEWQGWHQVLTEHVNQLPPRPVNSRAPNLNLGYNGKSWVFMPSDGGVYNMPEELAADIRQRHLDLAKLDAQAKDGEIADEIDQYRRRLHDYGRELIAQGYDLADGPLHKLWTGPELAEIDARMLGEELAKDNPDPAILDLYTQALQGIQLSVENPPGGALGPLDQDDIDYLGYFYANIDPEMALKLGDQPGVARTNIANGLNMFTNPAIGGIDPATATPDQIPQALRPFVYDYQNSGIFTDNEYGESFDRDLQQFNRFGALMGSATVMPGHEMAQDMTRAAIDIQERSNGQYRLGYSGYGELVLSEQGGTPITNTVSSDLLHNVSLNGAASNGILNDQALREDLLGQRWDRSEGVADVVTSGTTIPQDILEGPGGHNSDAARPFVQAGYNVLEYAANHQDNIHGAVTQGAFNQYIDGYNPDHAALERAVGHTMLNYMPMLADPSPGASRMQDLPADPNHYADTLFGTDYRHSFELSGGDRQRLFELMARSEQPVMTDFYTRVGEWQGETAAGAFQRAQSGQAVDGDFYNLGGIAGTVEYAQRQADVIGDANAQAANIAALNAGGSAAKDVFANSTVGKVGTIAGTLLFGEALRDSMPNPNAPIEAAHFNGVNYGDWAIRTLVADAAHASGVNPTALGPNPTPGSLDEYFRNSEHHYDAYAGQLTEGYEDANRPAPEAGRDYDNQPATQPR